MTEESTADRLKRIEQTVENLGPVPPMQTLRDLSWLLEKVDELLNNNEILRRNVDDYDQRCTRLRVQLERETAETFGASVKKISEEVEALATFEMALVAIDDVEKAPTLDDAKRIARDALSAVLSGPSRYRRTEKTA